MVSGNLKLHTDQKNKNYCHFLDPKKQKSAILHHFYTPFISGINFGRYDIQSFYQPDGIKFFEVNGVGYIAAADEGQNMESEIQRGKDFITSK